MSTRAQIIFAGTDVKIYKHMDGYPEEVLPILLPFVNQFFNQRGYDLDYLIAQTIRAFAFAEEDHRIAMLSDADCSFRESYAKRNLTLGYGVTRDWCFDVAYVYEICQDGRVNVYQAGCLYYLSNEQLDNKEGLSLIESHPLEKVGEAK